MTAPYHVLACGWTWARDIVVGELPRAACELGIKPLSRVNSADYRGRDQRRETRKLRRSGHREGSAADARFLLGNDPDRKHDRHRAHVVIRATLFQRLFASPSYFDLVCREFLADGNQSYLYERNSSKSFSGNRWSRLVCGG